MENTKVDPSTSPKPNTAFNYIRPTTHSSEGRFEPNMLSQPTTPRPYPIHTMAPKSHLAMNELSPKFMPAKSFELLYLSDKTTLSPIQIEAKMDRGFFLANNEWTCYRRNYFQVSTVFSLAHYSQAYYYVRTQRGTLEHVQRFLVGLSARVANSDKEIELIQQTAKRDKGPQFKPSPKPILPGGHLTTAHEQQSVATFERLQFKTATANNGKRRAAQQYFICNVDLYAETSDNNTVCIASCQSIPLVVRGRSPGHYADGLKSTTVQPATQVSDTYYYYQPSPYYYEKLPYIPTENNQDWQRSRYNSASSGSSSAPSPYTQESYFSQP
ncbi:hypothetical protein G6F46_006473 [Rhizopus delemar]|nr:hypothetical protein G6F53_009667 [Rhizopus delemar]KAG1542057.1 hypothetical protein G6F51_007508 [Rhizopus arrhizus]KAG1615073.1 hypothetical protein G6F46_006473 [Rhizopus delemar]KAG1628097.1 hypothetical protein G6F45_007175 [Rhizopus arrhizus]